MKQRKKSPAPRARAKPEKPKSVIVEVRTKKWGSRDAYVERVAAPLARKGTVTFSINMHVRETESIEVRPVRRDLGDVAGHLRDAERLANQPVG